MSQLFAQWHWQTSLESGSKFVNENLSACIAAFEFEPSYSQSTINLAVFLEGEMDGDLRRVRS